MSDPKPLNDAELAEIEKRTDAATPGPWEPKALYLIFKMIANEDQGWKDELPDGAWYPRRNDDKFIAASRTDIPRLLATIAARDAEIKRLRDGLNAVRVFGFDTLSGRVDGPADATWYLGSVREMTRRCSKVLRGLTWDASEIQP